MGNNLLTLTLGIYIKPLSTKHIEKSPKVKHHSG